jgi:hypothetical protein
MLLLLKAGVVMSFDPKDSDQSKVVELAAFKAKKEIGDELARGRQPLFISHKDGKLTGSPHMNRPQAEDFGDRLTRIKTSLEKINRLMSELKKISKDEGQTKSEPPVSILSRH